LPLLVRAWHAAHRPAHRPAVAPGARSSLKASVASITCSEKAWDLARRARSWMARENAPWLRPAVRRHRQHEAAQPRSEPRSAFWAAALRSSPFGLGVQWPCTWRTALVGAQAGVELGDLARQVHRCRPRAQRRCRPHALRCPTMPQAQPSALGGHVELLLDRRRESAGKSAAVTAAAQPGPLRPAGSTAGSTCAGSMAAKSGRCRGFSRGLGRAFMESIKSEQGEAARSGDLQQTPAC
jgi:hypothetical protein